MLHLLTNRIINRSHVTPIPVTPAIIIQVHKLARTQDQPEGLKIVNPYNIILYDAAWIAGVDFEDEEYDSDYSSDDEPLMMRTMRTMRNTMIPSTKIMENWKKITQMRKKTMKRQKMMKMKASMTHLVV